MNEEMVKLQELQGQVQKYSNEDYSEVVTSGKYLPRLQLMTSAAEKCKSGEFPINHYAVVKDSVFKDLGAETDILVIAWRPKALDMSDEVIASYDHTCDEFKRIAEKSGEQDSKCMYGPEYLVWLAGTQEFALFFMGSKSARRESAQLNKRLLKPATLKSKKIEYKDFVWYAPCASDCSTEFEVPTVDQVKEELERFNNPPATTVERVDEADAAASERAR